MRPQATLRVILTFSLIAAFGLGCAQMDTRGLTGGAGGLGAKSEKGDVADKSDEGDGPQGPAGAQDLPGSGNASDDNSPPKKDPSGGKKGGSFQVAQNKPQEVFGSQADPGNLGHGQAMIMGVPPYDPKGTQCPAEVALRIFHWPDVSPEKMSEEQTWDFIKDVRYKVTTKTATWDDFKGSLWREMKVPMQQVQGECQLAGIEKDETLAKLPGVYLMFWRPANIIPIVSTQATTPEEFKLFFPPPPPSPLKDKKTPPENY